MSDVRSDVSGATGVPSGAPDLAALVRMEYEAASDEQQSLRRWTRLASACLVVVLVGSLWSIVSMAADLWNPAQFQEPMAAQAREIVPVARRHAQGLMDRVGPVYVSTVRAQFEEALPEFRDSLAMEWSTLGSNLADTTAPEINDALERLQERQWKRLSVHFPSLRTDEGRQAFADRWHERVITDQATMLKELDLRFGPHVEALHLSMQKFRPNRFESWSQEDLSRYFVHLWLNLLDRHLLGLVDAEEVPDVR